MSSISVSASAFLWVFIVLCSDGFVYGLFQIYKSGGGGIGDRKLNVSIQGDCIENVVDSVVVWSLRADQNGKLIEFVEMAFLQRRWEEQNVEKQEEVRKLVDAGKLEFINGGRCMHVIDQTTLGHHVIKSQFNKTPRAMVQKSHCDRDLGFKFLHFASVDYHDRAKCKENNLLEVMWCRSKTLGSSSQIFANTFPVHYSPPDGFHFDVVDDFVPVQDNPLLFDDNVEERVNDYINATITQANVTSTNHTMGTMGDEANGTRTNHTMGKMVDEFQYKQAESWFKQWDKLVHYDNKYSTGGGIVEGKLNVHLVPHSHVDVGWLKTFDQYYGDGIKNVLDSVVWSLRADPNRKFVVAEMAIFLRWWKEQTVEKQEEVRKLVDTDQLEFINGGWVMHDEATSHYIDMIDQTTLGHRAIKSLFNKTPRAGWQIDPFGHSAVQAYLLGAELGFDSVHIARVDYQDRAKRKEDKSLEVIWRGSKTFGSSSQIFANVFPHHYTSPDGFHFEVFDDFVPVQDDPLLSDYNVEQRVNDFINVAITQANVTRTNHIMLTMGGDFKYKYAETWFKQMDKLIHYVNKDGRLNALYSTPSIYTDAKNAANELWPLKTDDYFPYADHANAYWTGYFTSRPALKRYIRMLSGYYLAARQLEFLAGRKSTGPSTFSLGNSLGIAQHHDAVTGTATQHTTNEYEKQLAIGASKAEAVTNSALSCLVNSSSSGQYATPNLTLSQCQLLNISFCPPTEEDIPDGKSLVVVAYNPLGWNRRDVIRVPVNDVNLLVQDSLGNTIEAQFVELDNVTGNIRNFYTQAYLGVSPSQVPKYWLFFQVSVPPLGWNTYFISKVAEKDDTGKRRSGYISKVDLPQNGAVEIGPGNLKMSFSLMSGQLKRMSNSKTGVDVPVQQSYLWYGSSGGDTDPQCSGAYIFRPNRAPPDVVSISVPLKVIRGPLVDEVHQQFNSWIYQVIRLYRDKEHVEVEFTIGPIPTNDSVGKEVITRMATNMVTNKVFYTDSNGRDFLKRVRDYREDWSLSVTQPVAGNYYPLNLGIFTMDDKSEFSVLVDRATGGASIEDGEIELMLHRRTLSDDSRGVVEALDETVCVGTKCEGLTVRGNYYMSINQLGAGSKWRRTTGQEIYSPLLLAFTHEKMEDWTASHSMEGTAMDPTYSLPINVALVTLQALDDGEVLLRLAHLYEAGEDAEYSALATVELKKIFAGKEIKEVKEMNLSANQEKSKMKKMVWKVEGDSEEVPHQAIRGDPVNNSTLVVELGPMEIRTFLLKF